MGQTRIDIPGVGVVEFPDSMSPDEVNAAAGKLYRESNRSGDSDALVTSMVGPASRAATAIATSPTLPKSAATVGRITGAIAPMAAGAYEYGLPGFFSGAVGAAKGSWAGGKTGYFTGKLLQNATMPIAKGLSAAAPYATVLSGAQGVGDLAQMAEPDRKDIGVLGVGRSVDVPGAHPPVLNALLARLRAALGR